MVTIASYDTWLPAKMAGTVEHADAVGHRAGLWTILLASVDMYSYFDDVSGCLVYCLGNARYVNHSDQPNSGIWGPHHSKVTVASKGRGHSGITTRPTHQGASAEK